MIRRDGKDCTHVLVVCEPIEGSLRAQTKCQTPLSLFLKLDTIDEKGEDLGALVARQVLPVGCEALPEPRQRLDIRSRQAQAIPRRHNLLDPGLQRQFALLQGRNLPGKGSALPTRLHRPHEPLDLARNLPKLGAQRWQLPRRRRCIELRPGRRERPLQPRGMRPKRRQVPDDHVMERVGVHPPNRADCPSSGATDALVVPQAACPPRRRRRGHPATAVSAPDPPPQVEVNPLCGGPHPAIDGIRAARAGGWLL